MDHWEKQYKKEQNFNVLINSIAIILLPTLVWFYGFDGILYWIVFMVIGFIWGIYRQNTESKAMKDARKKDVKESIEKRKKLEKKKKEEDTFLKGKIVALLERKLGEKISAKDIHRFIDPEYDWSPDYIKDLCEDLYFEEKVQRTGNYRYYIL